MEKKMFEKFIAKYNLGGACESVVYTVDNNAISTRAISDDKNVLCEVSATDMQMPDGKYSVYDTSKLKSMLNVLGETLLVNVKTSNNKPTSISFNDESTEVTYVLADIDVIPNVPDLKKLPVFELNVSLDEFFINTFVRAKGALSDVDTFTIISDGSSATAEVVLGFSSLNTNRIKITANTTEPVAIEPISFSAKYLREIFVANREVTGGNMWVSSKGLSKVVFSGSQIESTYYLVQINDKN